MPELPTGTVTFLFSDVEGSTQLLYRLGDERGGEALAEHARLLREAFAHHAGREVDTQGDSFFVAFARASDAIAAAAEGQRALASHAWADGTPVRVRMALLTGEPHVAEGGYAGIDVHRAARICAAGHGGQVLLAESTGDLAGNTLPEGLGLRDLGEQRLKDLQRREHIYQLVITGLPADFPPLRTLDALPNNLPLQLTSFVGRQTEMAAVIRLLDQTRLLTLTGPGGTGKTRLALQVAADRLDNFPDGAWLVELAPLADPAMITGAVAGVLGVHEVPGRSMWDGLLDYLRHKQTLLVLDNCEHMIEAASRIADGLLHACPRLRILATSREALGIAGETSYRVPSLPLPDQSSALSAATALQSEAVRLFAERAGAALPSFVLTDANSPAVVQICRRLDGIPLAIELAAARVRALPVEQIAAHLDDRFRVLTGGSRTALPRHQTLRALIDWSYDLLSPAECSLLRRLSVFAGGWTFEAVEQVCGDLDVLDLLPRLVDKSLVLLDEHGQRYRMLETVRQYARDKLLESGEATAVRDRHLAFYLALAEEAAPELLSANARAWLDRLTADADNLRAAVEWALHTDPDRALRLVGSLKDFLGRRHLGAEGYQWCTHVLALTEGPTPPGREQERLRGRADASLTLSIMAIFQADNAVALAAATQSARLWRGFGETLPLIRALDQQALAAVFLRERALAISSADEALALVRAHPEPLAATYALTMRARIAVEFEHDPSAARSYIEESNVYARSVKYKWAVAMQLMGLGVMAARDGAYAAARTHLGEGIALFEAEGDSYFANVLRSELADAERLAGDVEAAGRLFAAVLPEWQKAGNRGAIARVLECLGFLARAGAAGAGSGPERDRQLERMVRLWGAAEALREVAQAPMTEAEQAEYVAEVEAGRAMLPEESWAAAWTAGRSLDMEQAIAYALEG